MAYKKNTQTRNTQIAALGAIFNGGKLQIRTGSQPASPNDAATGTLLVEINLPNPAFGAASGGSISKSGTWSNIAVASGTAGWARFISSDTTKTMDCTVAESGGDLTIDDDAITSGAVVTVTACTLTAGNA
jgi:hypothetical protein